MDDSGTSGPSPRRWPTPPGPTYPSARAACRAAIVPIIEARPTMPTTGTITQVIGSTFDAQFPEDDLPQIYNAIKVEQDTPVGHIDLTGEVQQHLGGGRVRAVALGGTDGLRRGMEVADTGSPVTVPVGEQVLGRVFFVLG